MSKKLNNYSNRRITFNPGQDMESQCRSLIEEALGEHGVRSVKAIANLTGLSTSTIYRYRNPTLGAYRMQLPTFIALKRTRGL